MADFGARVVPSTGSKEGELGKEKKDPQGTSYAQKQISKFDSAMTDSIKVARWVSRGRKDACR